MSLDSGSYDVRAARKRRTKTDALTQAQSDHAAAGRFSALRCLEHFMRARPTFGNGEKYQVSIVCRPSSTLSMFCERPQIVNVSIMAFFSHCGAARRGRDDLTFTLVTSSCSFRLASSNPSCSSCSMSSTAVRPSGSPSSPSLCRGAPAMRAWQIVVARVSRKPQTAHLIVAFAFSPS